MKKYVLQILAIAALVFPAFTAAAQTLSLGNVFRPGLRVAYSKIPETAFKDQDTNYDYDNFRAQLIIPGKANINLSLKDLDASASQHFYTARFARRNVTGFTEDDQAQYQAEIGLIGLRAAIRGGMIMYGIQAGVQWQPDLPDSHIRPSVTAGIAKFKINSLRTQWLYGLALNYQNERLLPFPILGVMHKLGKPVKLKVLLPVLVKVSWRILDDLRLDLNASPGLNGFYFREITPALSETISRAREQHLKFSALLQLKASSRVRIFAEGGYLAGRKLTLKHSSEKTSLRTKNTAYFDVGLAVSFGNAWFDSKLAEFD